MRKKRIWKALGIGVALVGVLLLLFVVAFVFNPFEGKLPDMRELVPRNVDYFARKAGLGADFTDFPEPEFWAEFAASGQWRQLRTGPAVRDLERDLGAAIEQLREAAAQVRDASAGFAGLVDDVLGSELIVAGRFVPPSLDRLAAIAYLRVSWKVRFAWGLLGWEGVRAQVAGGGVQIEARADGTLAVTPSGGQRVFVARHLDCLMVSNDDALLQESLALAKGRGGESLGGSPDYRDGVLGKIRDWEQIADASANALEVYLRPEQLFPITRWDDGWPDRRAADINERVLASFLNLEGWRFLTGSFVFEPESLTLLGRVDLNRNKHTPFQAEFFKSEPQDRSQWLDPFLSMVPETACAAAAVRMPAREFLQEMYEAVDADLREEIDRQLRKTGKYDGVRALIDTLEDALLRRIGFVFHRARELGAEIKVFEPSPAPHVAWVFWIRPEMRNKLTELYEFLKVHWTTLGFEQAYDYPVVGLKGGDAAREFVNPNIPGTGEIVVLLYGNFFVLSNSAVLVRDMVGARLQDRSIVGTRDYETFATELRTKLNGFVMLNGDRLAEVVEDHVAFLERKTQTPDEGWMLENRTRVERQVLRERFPGYRAVAELPEAQRGGFDQAVDAALTQEWSTVRARVIAEDSARLQQLRAMASLVSSAYMQVTLDPQSIDLTARMLLRYR